MKLAVARARQAFETRVAATPATVKKLTALGLETVIESGAGAQAHISDADYAQAGATVAPSLEATLQDADIILTVQTPSAQELSLIRPGACLIGMLAPLSSADAIGEFAQRGINAFAMELMPRITRAQSMDVLSSQSNLAGYRAVLEACYLFGRAMPMMMTAAGTIAPARVMVLGAGVAGLQAIATARRLGAIVSATDVRPAAKEQVESLGAAFVMVESEETKAAETDGGYARKMSDEYQRAQSELIAQTLKKQDIAICTALIPGRPAPVLITEEMVRSMKPGSVIVDLAVEQGGNCPLSKPGESIEVHGVTIIGHCNMPGRLAVDASALYANNLLNFITPLIAEDGTLTIDWDDEIVIGTALTRAGEVISSAVGNPANGDPVVGNRALGNVQE